MFSRPVKKAYDGTNFDLLVVILVVIKPRLGLRVNFGIKNMKNTMQNINLAWLHYIHWEIYEFSRFLLVKIKKMYR